MPSKVRKPLSQGTKKQTIEITPITLSICLSPIWEPKIATYPNIKQTKKGCLLKLFQHVKNGGLPGMDIFIRYLCKTRCGIN